MNAKLYTTEADWVFFQRVSAESIYGMKIDKISLAVIKETVDNFLDAAEKQKVDPEIEVKYTTARVPEREGIEKVEIEMTSNTLMSREDIERVYSAPFGSRTNSKTFVKVPSRGLFGMANKLIQALPYMLSMELGLSLPQTPIEIQASSEGSVYIYNIGADASHSAPFSAPCVAANTAPLTSRSFPLSVL
jgi:DNA topoisomerase VI subunit B